MQSRHPEGQISLLIALFFSTFIVLFAFVIHIGMLVNAKINLQNAADLAAYAGAAVQARQLTQIAYLNYEMRRQYKKFLFRIYVLGNMAQQGFPRGNPSGGASATAATYKPTASVNYGSPTTCVVFDANDNFCQITNLPPIAIPPPSALDAISNALSGQLTTIEAIREQNCRAIGVTNLMLNIFWLYNADPNLSNLSALDQLQNNTATILRTLAQGLGIIPREMLLRWRIKTLNAYVNATAQTNLSFSQVKSMQQSADLGGLERSIQAFYSAYYTLGNHIFPGGNVTMDELLPGNEGQANLLALQEISSDFDLFGIDFDLGAGTGNAGPPGNLGNSANPTGNACIAKSVPISLPNPLPFGVYKDPTVLTYYAIRLKATAHLLFSPFGDIQLKAYAAAKPFGSRIGPTAQQVSFVSNHNGGPSNTTNSMGLTGNIPNLAVRSMDSSSRGAGWDTVEMLGTMYENLIGSNIGSITYDQLEAAYETAMAPSPWEVQYYTIINDQGMDPFVKNFDSQNLAAFWAPLYTADTSFSASGNLTTAITNYFTDSVDGNLGTTSPTQSFDIIKSSIQNNLQKYIGTSLTQGNGENGEGIHIAKISNPFYHLKSNAPIQSGVFTVTDPSLIKTSWNDVNRSDFQSYGRTGYSVKFISFASLMTNKNTTDGKTTWMNGMTLDSEAQQDMPFIKH